MSIIFNGGRQQAAFYTNAIGAGDLHSPVLIESEEQIRMEHAHMTFRNWCFDGFRMACNTFGQQQETGYNIHNDIDAVKLYFNRKGSARIAYHQLGKKFNLGSGQYNMLYAAELDSRMEHVCNNSEMFSLQITRPCFEELAETGDRPLRQFAHQAAMGRPVLFSEHWQRISPAMEQCINDMLHCPFAPGLKKLYLHSKAVELLVLFAHAGTAQPAHSSIAAADREKLYFIKQYLEQHYTGNHTLSSLAKTAELNEFKLKQGFKHLFNASVIDYLIDYRLEKAREILLSSSKNVAEIAYETGYTSPAYFGRAYKKKFGHSPKQRS